MCPLAETLKYVLPMECKHPYYHITDVMRSWMAHQEDVRHTALDSWLAEGFTEKKTDRIKVWHL